MTIINPTQLVDEFKKSGEFDRLRRELLTQFQRGDSTASFTSRVEDIARQRLLSDQKLQYMPPDAAHRELMKEMDRYPIVERAVGELQMFADPSFITEIRNSVQKILREDRGKASSNMAIDEPPKAPSRFADGTIPHGASPRPSVMAPTSAAVSDVAPAASEARSSCLQIHMTTTDTSIPATQTLDEKDVGTSGLITSNDTHIPSCLVEHGGENDSARRDPNPV